LRLFLDPPSIASKRGGAVRLLRLGDISPFKARGEHNGRGPGEPVSLVCNAREGFLTPSPGVELHYVDIGPREGRPLIFIHGLTANTAFYGPLLHALARPWRVIGLDLRGHGLSSKPEGGYTLPRLSEDIRALAEHLDITSYVLVGHCLGAIISLYHAAREPDAVEALVAVELPSPVMRPSLNHLSCWTCVALARGLSALGSPGREAIFLMALASLMPEGAGRTLRRWLSSNIVQDGRTGLRWAFSWHAVAEIMRGLLGLDVSGLLKAVRCPVLLVRGSRGLFWASDAEEMASLLPEARLITVQKAGHIIFTVALGPLSGAIRRFLEDTLG